MELLDEERDDDVTPGIEEGEEEEEDKQMQEVQIQTQRQIGMCRKGVALCEPRVARMFIAFHFILSGMKNTNCLRNANFVPMSMVNWRFHKTSQMTQQPVQTGVPFSTFPSTVVQ